jgi:hypothetical protein
MALTYPADLAALRQHWPSATSQLMSDEVATRYAAVAEETLTPWAPAGLEPTAASPRWVLAVALHASDLANAAAREGDLEVVDGYTLRVRPVSDAVKAILRPPSPVPAVG